MKLIFFQSEAFWIQLGRRETERVNYTLVLEVADQALCHVNWFFSIMEICLQFRNRDYIFSCKKKEKTLFPFLFWCIIFKKGDSIASEFYTFHSQNRFLDNKHQVSEMIFLSREWRNPTKRREIVFFFCFRKVTNSQFSHWIIESLKCKYMEFLWNGKSLRLWDLNSKNMKNNLFFLHERWGQ